MAVGQLPHGIVIQKIAPRLWFPSMVVVWALLTVFHPSPYGLAKLAF